MIVEISGRPSARSPGAGGDRDERGDVRAGVGDELLRAVDDPLAVVEHRLGLASRRRPSPHRARSVRSRRSCSPATSVGQPGLLLLVGAVGQDRVDPQADRGLERDAHRLVDAADLLDRQAQRREAAVLARHPGAAELLRSRQPHQAERAHLLDDVGREVVVAVPLRGVRRDLGLGEVADAAAELLVLGGQLEGHASHPSAGG